VTERKKGVGNESQKNAIAGTQLDNQFQDEEPSCRAFNAGTTRLRPASKNATGMRGDMLSTKQTAWMPHTLRTWLIALRPWSFPASLVPVALAGAATHRLHGIDLLSADFVLSFVVVLATHAAGNLSNTYFDFKNGVDKENADDRTLVDRTVNATGVISLAMGLFALALAILCFFVMRVGSHYAYVAVPAVALSLFYTANPFNLKALGLGDAVVFACFGPLLMLSVYITLSGTAASTEGASTVMALSFPIGLLTVAILHANNTRDVEADKAAGVFTVAQALGKAGCEKFYIALFGGAYACAVALTVIFGWRCLIVLCTAPWAKYVVSLFQHEIMDELPQRTAQHNLLFGVLLTGAICTPMFFARFLLGCLFYLGGVHNIIMWNYTVHNVQEKISNVVHLPMKVTTPLFALAVAIQLPCSVLFILGYHTRIAAQVLLAWLVVITFTVHNIWTIEGEEYGSGGGGSHHFAQVLSRTVPNFPTEFDAEFVHFFKNVGMMGGLVIYLEMGGGL